MLSLFVPLVLWISLVLAKTNWTQTSTGITLWNDRVSFVIVAANNTVQNFTLDGIDLLGPFGHDVTGRATTTAANTEQVGSLFYDGYCVPARNATMAANPNAANARKVYIGIGGPEGNATYQVHYGVDKTNISWVGAVMSYKYVPSNQTFNQYWFLRDGETGFHMFSRAAYHNYNYANNNVTDLGNLQELRTLISPNSNMWTHLVTSADQYSQHPSAEAVQKETVIQDASWYFNLTNDAYVTQESSYFTKYSWTNPYRKHKAHGFFADGSQSNGTGTAGLWTVFNNLENYLGGPIRTDLLVDTNIYNYYSSNHYGASTPNITTGFDRLFGPTYIYANKGGNLTDLLSDAESYASPTFASDFYDSIAPLVPGFAPAYTRGNVSFNITLPAGASNAVAILSENGAAHQDNMAYNASQYWAELGSSGVGGLVRVKSGIYRLTVYADGIFGDYIQDDVSILASTNNIIALTWVPTTHGTEIFRIGVPDKTAGEFKHGFQRDPTHTNHPREYRAYWGQYDFVDEFPQGVNFTVGTSVEANDFNYIHYSAFGGSFTRPGFITENVNPWYVNFGLNSSSMRGKTDAIFTVQLASVRSSAGNTDIANLPNANVTWTLEVNRQSNVTWEIPFWHSSSSAWRSGISGYVTAQTLYFPSSWLEEGNNTFAFYLPFNVSVVSVQYDALRLELA